MKRTHFIAIVALILLVGLGICLLKIDPADFLTQKNLSDWAYFATFLGVILSLISVYFIYLTYQNQTNMSSVLQFESTFFQWFQIHVNLTKDLQYDINKEYTDTVMPKLMKGDFTNVDDLSLFEQLANKDIGRPLHQYYRSLYQLLKYIYLSPFLTDYDQRKKYYDIIQSNMSDKELLLLLCFVLGDQNRTKPVFKKFKFSHLFKRHSNPNTTISIIELIDKGHILKNCYVPNPVLLRYMTALVRHHFPETQNSFHFFTAEAKKEGEEHFINYGKEMTHEMYYTLTEADRAAWRERNGFGDADPIFVDDEFINRCVKDAHEYLENFEDTGLPFFSYPFHMQEQVIRKALDEGFAHYRTPFGCLDVRDKDEFTQCLLYSIWNNTGLE